MQVARVSMAPFFTRSVVLRTLWTSFALSWGIVSAVEVGNGPEVCMPMSAVVASLEQLDNEVESTRLKLLAALEKVLTEGEIESSSVEEYRREVHEYEIETERCEHQRVEARLDVETYRRELQELWEIAHEGIQNHNTSWTALSLLGERSVTSVQKATKTERRQVRVSAGVKRGAEMHWGLVKHAQAVKLCQEKKGDLQGSGNFSRYLNMSNVDASDPCVVRYQRLRAVYREAYLHISTLLQSAVTISESSACFQATYSLHENKHVMLDLKIQGARKAMCQGHVTGLEAEVHARRVRERLWATQRLIHPGCYSLDWNAYAESVEALVHLTVNRPQCSTCCRMANMSEDPFSGSALLESAGSSGGAGTGDRAAALERRIEGLRSRWHHAEEGAPEVPSDFKSDR